MLRLVAFDLDGTIGDTVDLSLRALREVVERHLGHTVTDADIDASIGLNDRGTLFRLLGYDDPNAVSTFTEIYRSLHHICPSAFNGIQQLIAYLRQQGLITALVTGKGIGSCSATLEQFGLLNAFDSILTGGFSKDIKADNLRYLLDKYGLEKQEAIYIGDTVRDIESCRDVGICCLTAAWASSANERRRCEQLNQGLVFSSVDKLSTYIRALIRHNAT